MCNTCGHLPCNWTDDLPPELDPFAEPTPPTPPPPEQKAKRRHVSRAKSNEEVKEDRRIYACYALRVGEASGNEKLSAEIYELLRTERLKVVQIYKGHFLLECKVCTWSGVFETHEEDRFWSCADCDRVKLRTYLELSPVRAVARKSRAHDDDEHDLAA